MELNPPLCGGGLHQRRDRARGDREDDVHRVLADDRRENAGARRDIIADRHQGAADLAVDRRANVGVAEIDLRLVELRLGAQHLGLEGQLVRLRGVDGRLLPGRGVEQRLGARQGQVGVLQLRLVLSDHRLLRLDIGLERALLEAVEQLALLDFRAFGEVALVKESRDAGDEVDPVGRLDAADILARRGDRLPDGRHDADRRRRRRRLLRDNAERRQAKDEGEQKRGPTQARPAALPRGRRRRAIGRQ